MIAKCANLTQVVNGYHLEVEHAFGIAKNKARVLELQYTVGVDAQLCGPLRAMDMTGSDKMAMARKTVSEEYRKEAYEEALLVHQEEGGLEAPPRLEDFKTLLEEQQEVNSLIESLNSLKKVIAERKMHLKQVDSAVRLQYHTVESEARLMGGLNPSYSLSRKGETPKKPPISDVVPASRENSQEAQETSFGDLTGLQE
jgi:hypothetical protein